MTIFETRTPMSDPIREKLMKMVDDYITPKNPEFLALTELKARIDGMFMVHIRNNFSVEEQAILEKFGATHMGGIIHYFEGNGREGNQTARTKHWMMEFTAPCGNGIGAIKNIHPNSAIAKNIRKYEKDLAEHKQAMADAKSPYWRLIDDAVTLEEVCQFWTYAEKLLVKIRKDLDKETSHYNKRWALRNPKEWTEGKIMINAAEMQNSDFGDK